MNLKGADAVVFKMDYLSHKQWYAVRDYAKKCGRKIIYCRNNIPMMFEQIERALKWHLYYYEIIMKRETG